MHVGARTRAGANVRRPLPGPSRPSRRLPRIRRANRKRDAPIRDRPCQRKRDAYGEILQPGAANKTLASACIGGRDCYSSSHHIFCWLIGWNRGIGLIFGWAVACRLAHCFGLEWLINESGLACSAALIEHLGSGLSCPIRTFTDNETSAGAFIDERTRKRLFQATLIMLGKHAQVGHNFYSPMYSM